MRCIWLAAVGVGGLRQPHSPPPLFAVTVLCAGRARVAGADQSRPCAHLAASWRGGGGGGGGIEAAAAVFGCVGVARVGVGGRQCVT